MCNPRDVKTWSFHQKEINLYPFPDIPTVNGRVYSKEVMDAAIESHKRPYFYVDLLQKTHDYGSSQFEVDLMNVVGTVDKDTIKYDSENNVYKAILKIMISHPEKQTAVKIYELMQDVVYAFRGVGDVEAIPSSDNVTISNYTIISINPLINEGQLR